VTPRHVVIVLAILLLNGCGSRDYGTAAVKESAVFGQPYTLTATERRAVEDGVRKRLKDPLSAIFSELVARRGERGEIAVCGHVNAKNAYGGYVGRQPFRGTLMAGPPPVFSASTVDDIGDDVIAEICSRTGIPIPD